MGKRYFQEYGPISRRREGRRPELPTVEPMYDLYEEQAKGQPVPLERPTTGRPKRKQHRSPLIWLGVMALVLLLAVAGGLLYLNQRYQGRIYPNIAINGIDIGEKTPEQARAALERQLQDFLDQPVTLSYSGQSWQPTLAELGVTIELDKTVEEAYQTGRSLNLVANVERVVQTWQEGLNLPVELTVDGPQMARYLEGITSGINRTAVDANLIIADTGATISPAQEGRLVLIDETALDLVAALQSLQHQDVAIRTELLVPHLRESGVSEAQRTVNAFLQAPVTFKVRDREWTITQDELRAMIRVERIEGQKTDQLTVSVDEVALRQRIATIADEIGRGSVNPRVHWNDGNLTIFRPGQVGLRLDEDASYEKVSQHLTSSERTIDLVVHEVQPEVTEENLNGLGIKEVVGVGKSSFKGSAPYRVTNIKAGSALLHGVLIAPDEEFSFNRTIGSIDARNGFVEGYAIIGNRTQLEFGGGICQDSTTLFRAAFHAGLPITERHEHSFRISWYEHFEPYGMDAAIFTGALDLRFVNDTGHWLLLQTYVNERKQELTYVLYGSKPDREVIRSEPIVTNEIPAPKQPNYVPDTSIRIGQFKQTDTARGGMTITIYRIIKENGVVVKREPFVTTFKPWPNIYLYNPKTPLPPPGCLPYQCNKPEPTPAPTEPPQPTPNPAQQPTPPPQPTPDPAQQPPPPTPDPAQQQPPPPQPTPDPAQQQPPPTADPGQQQPAPGQGQPPGGPIGQPGNG